MQDPEVIIAIVIAVASIVGLFFYRKSLKRFYLRISKDSIDAIIETKDKQKDSSVDLSDAEFGDNNEFSVDKQARVNATKLKAGNGNQFQFGSPDEKRDTTQ